MAFLICGKEGGPGKEKHISTRGRHCFGLKLLSSSHHQPREMESFSVLVKRGENGFGFSLTGSNPAKVKVVKQDSTAYFAGLRKGDRVMRINEENCAHLPAESLAKVVRQSETQILLDIERETSRKSTSSSSHKVPPAEISETSHSDDLSESDQRKISAIHQLVHCEKDFLALIQHGCQHYSTPLRHMVSPTEHGTLFQNIDQMLVLSEYHVFKLDDMMTTCDRSSNYIDIIGSVYSPRLLMMKEVFEQYCDGIKNAFRLLGELKQFEDFKSFFNETSGEMGRATISVLLQKPLEYIQRLLTSLQRVLSLSDLQPGTTNSLVQVIDAVRSICNHGNRINNTNTRRSRSMTSIVSRSSTRSRSSCKSSKSSTSLMSCDTSRSSVKSADSSIESSLDPEVIQIQRRLIFSEHVQPFQLATATRHMIYAGELTHVDGEQLYVVLMSDFILLTKMIADERLLVVDYPLLLQDVVSTDFGGTDSLTMCLTAQCSIDDDWLEECDIVLKAPSIEQKYTWKNILEQRIQSCQVQQEFLNSENFI